MTAFLTERVREIAERMGGREIKLSPREGLYDSMLYQTTHNTGGTIMGTDPASSASTAICKAGTCRNLFVMGAGVFPQNACYNPTGHSGGAHLLGGGRDVAIPARPRPAGAVMRAAGQLRSRRARRRADGRPARKTRSTARSSASAMR